MDDVRCPKCAALVAPGASWCSLCYHDLRPAPEPEPVATDALEEPALEAEPAPVPVPDLGPAGDHAAALPAPVRRRGRHARHDPAAPADATREDGLSALDATAEAAAEELLLQLRHETRMPSMFSNAAAQLDSQGAKIAVMIGGLVLVSVALFAMLTLFGTLL